MKLNNVLAEEHRHFGYRVLNEAALFVRNARDLIDDDPAVIDAAIDIQILQKIAPKMIFGECPSQRLMQRILEMCITGEISHRDAEDAPTYDPDDVSLLKTAKYPRSTERFLQLLYRMNESLATPAR